MEFKRWPAFLALSFSLSFRAFALAQELNDQPDVPSVDPQPVIGTLVSEEVENPHEAPPNSDSEEQRTRIQLPNGDSIEAGQITIQLPNGETKIIHLTNSSSQWTSTSGNSPDEASLPKFVIGVSLSEIPESLRAHITLPEGTGVMVGSIVPDSPASKSELRQFDILLKSGDKDLKHPKDLQQLVDASEGQPVLITLQRQGEPKTIEVTPIKREDLKFPSSGDFNLPSVPGNVAFMVQSGQLPMNITWPQSILPYSGVMPLPAGTPGQMEELTQSIRSLTEQIERLKASVDRLEKQQEGHGGSDEPESNRTKDDGDCWQLPRRTPLTKLIRFS